MRAATCWMLSLAWVALCCVPAADAASRCAAPSDSRKPAKASSFAPHANSPNHVYGVPIEKPILKYRPKAKSQRKSEPHLKSGPQPKSDPQLKSEPLPQG